MNILNKTSEVLNSYSDITLYKEKSKEYNNIYTLVSTILGDTDVDNNIFISICILYKINNIEKQLYSKVVEEVRMRGLFKKMASINRLLILLKNICSQSNIDFDIENILRNINQLSYKDISTLKLDDDLKVQNISQHLLSYIKILFPNYDISKISKKYKVKRYVDIINEKEA